MSRFALSPQDVKILQLQLALVSPLLLVGASMYGVHRGVGFGFRQMLKRRRRQTDAAKARTALQQLHDEARRYHKSTWHILGLAVGYLVAGDAEKATTELAEALAIETEVMQTDRLRCHYYAAVRFYMGRAALALGKWDDAVAAFDDAAKHLSTPPTPADPGFKRNYGMGIGTFIARDDTTDEECGAAALRHMVESCAELGVTCADSFCFAAYALLLRAMTRPSDVDGLITDIAGIQGALLRTEQAFAHGADNTAGGSSPRLAMVAAWCEFYLALPLNATRTAVVAVDVERLQRALAHLERAEAAATAAESEAAALQSDSAAAVDDGGAEDESDGEDASTSATASSTTTPPLRPGEGAGGIHLAEVLSLRAQILLALGGQDDAAVLSLSHALQLDPNVPHSGLCTTPSPSVTDPRVGLLRPWPLQTTATPEDQRRSATGGTSVGGASEPAFTAPQVAPRAHTHNMQLQRVAVLHTCVHCARKIMAMTKALKCQSCDAYAHAKCGPDMTDAVVVS